MKLRTITTAFVAAALVAAVPSAASAATDKETRQMMADIRMLQEQEQQIQNVLAALTDALKANDAKLNARLDEQADAVRKSFADERTIVTNILNDLRTVREKLDDNTTRVGQIDAEVQALRQLITAQRSSFVAPPDPSGASAPDATNPSADASLPAASGESPTALYNAAFGDYSSGQYDLAVIGFRAYIKSFPTGPQAADAQLMICSAFTQDRKYAEAVDACDLTIRNYPKFEKLPVAYYRKAVALKELHQPDQARAALDYIIKTWPDSDTRALAEQVEASLAPAPPPARR